MLNRENESSMHAPQLYPLSKSTHQMRNRFIVKHLMQNYNNQKSFVKIEGSNIFFVDNKKTIKHSKFRCASQHQDEELKDKKRQLSIQPQPMIFQQGINISQRAIPKRYQQYKINSEENCQNTSLIPNDIVNGKKLQEYLNAKLEKYKKWKQNFPNEKYENQLNSYIQLSYPIISISKNPITSRKTIEGRETLSNMNFVQEKQLSPRKTFFKTSKSPQLLKIPKLKQNKQQEQMIPKTKMGKQSDLTGFDKHYEEDNDLADLAEYVQMMKH